jgi:parallel beta-helix repeat protein
MIKKISALLLFVFLISTSFAQVSIKSGMIIKRSTKIKKDSYNISSINNLSKAVIVIEGNNITVDFNDAVLKGNKAGENPDEFQGVAVLIKKGKNITIKNLKASGYKIALLARNVEGLKLENCDFSYNYRKKLNSTQEKEDISDWMSYHQNEKDEWLRYGAAIYLKKCNKVTITNCTVTNGQNALMMTECNNSMIYNNDFSFNSGIGIGLYRSGNNKFMYNRVIFNVRGYSHGVYNRGQDSAGFLVYEQSNNNLFYKNAATHSGDGFFLWAGQSTMNTGKGGCNDNILLENDFSYAPTNGIEVTFSRNKIIKNRIYECDHGIWGGYSYNTKISDNQFRNNRIAIAIEHGQENIINHNLFYADKTAIKLWARSQQPADWGYARLRDTRSRNYILAANSFNNNQVVFDLAKTDSIAEFSNIYNGHDTLFKTDTSLGELDVEENDDMFVKLSEDENIFIPEIKNPNNPFKGAGRLAGRKNILMTAWGPYNFQYPIIWNTNPTDTTGKMEFDVLGPKGEWKIVSMKGVSKIAKLQDSFPASFVTMKDTSATTDIEIIAEYTGEEYKDQFGNNISPGKPGTFVFRKFFQPIDWNISWYSFDASTNPVKNKSIEFIKGQSPFKTERTDKINYAWWGGIKAKDKQFTEFITVAEGNADIKQGIYELSVTWDDAVRVYVDNKLVIDEWIPALHKFDESPNKKVKLELNGNHLFKVEHVELGGFATLSVRLNKLYQ